MPPTRLLPPRRRRAIPYLYTPEEIAALMDAAAELRGALHAATHQTLIGLMAVTGMRLGEVIALDRDDVDARHALLRIIDSKFGKSREVALHESAMHALHDYSRPRDDLCRRLRSEAFFVSSAGTRLLGSCVHRVFARLVSSVDLKPRSPRCRPRMHDLRHSFAVRTLLDWCSTNAPVQARLPSLSTYMGPRQPGQHLLLPDRRARAARPRGPTPRTSPERTAMTALAPTLQAYFTDRLLCQRRVSPNTVASYRDAFRLLLSFMQQKTGTPPARLQLTQLDAPTIGAFLELIQRVLAIPPKRAEKRTVTFLTPAEVTALLDSPDRATWAGRRDHALLLTAVQTGLRVSELLAPTRADVHLGTGAHVRAIGKERKERVAPLTVQTVAVLRVWMRESEDQPASPLFPSSHGGPLTRDGIERRLARHIATAQRTRPTLGSRRVSMHVLRHTAAMTLLNAGVDTSTIALWLGHEQERTTHVYLRRPRAQTAHA